MTDEQEVRYKVIFLGPAQNTIEYVNRVAEGLQERFNLSADAVTKMMRLAPVAIKKEVALSEAQRYQGALEAIGAKIKLEPMEQFTEGAEEEGTAPPSPAREPQIIPLRGRTPPSPPPPDPTTTGEMGQKMIQCPQCGFVQEKADECIRCGVVISKFLKYQEEIKAFGDKRETQGFIGTSLEEEKGSTPWEDMANLGFITAFFRTMKEVLFSPSRFFRKMSVDKGIQTPLFYGIITGFLGGLSALLWQYALQAIAKGVTLFYSSFIVGYALVLPFLIAIGLFIISGIFHVCLMIVGGSKRGFEATFRVVAYTNSTQIFIILPFLGGLIAGIYNLVLWIIGFRESHRTTTGRAFIAVFLPMVIVTIFIVILIAAVLIPLIASLPQLMQQQPPPF